MEPLLELRVSRVAPAVEGNLVQLVDMVKQLGRKGNLTESQNRKMVGYLGNLDDMRSQIVIMIQRYEDDSRVLKRLLELVDRIDDVKNLALTAETSKGEEGTLISDQEIAEQYDTPFNPLMVSTLNILDVSGLFADKIIDEDEEGEEGSLESEEDGDAFWDHEDDLEMLAPEELIPREITGINLSMSNMYLPSLFESCDNVPTIPPLAGLAPSPLSASLSLSLNAAVNLHPSSLSSSYPGIATSEKTQTKREAARHRNTLSASDQVFPSLFDSAKVSTIPVPPPSTLNSNISSPPPPPPLYPEEALIQDPNIPIPPPLPPLKQQKNNKGKGKATTKRQLGVDTRNNKVKDAKGKGKGKAKVTFKNISDSSSLSGSEEESLSESDYDGPDGAQQAPPITIGWRRTFPGKKTSSSSSSSSSQPAPKKDSESSSEYESKSETESGSESESSGSASDSDVPRNVRRNTRGSSSAAKPKKTPKTARKRGPCDPPVLCKICYEEYDKWEKVHQFGGCDHTYCRECLRDYLATHITEGAVLDLTCPYPECQTEFPPADIKFLCTSEIYSKYERFTLLAALRADPNARWCPNPYCNNGIKHNPETMPWVYCNACKFEFCFHCMAERHDGVACGQEALDYLKKKHESEMAAVNQFNEFTELMKSFVKPCPGCKAFIEKNDGCNHMTCTNPSCRTQFCWLCLNLYTGDHFVDDVNFPDCYDKQYWTPPEILLQTAQIARQAAVVPRGRRFANIAKKVGMYMGVGVAVVTLGVPAAVIGGPVYGCFKLHKRLKARRRRLASQRNDWVPPTPQRIAEARREARRLYELEHS